MRRATQCPPYHRYCFQISIHALLAESDLRRSASIWLDKYFYPRSPCGERRSPCMIWSNIFLFLSTLSLRRATKAQDEYKDTMTISIHALLAESDGASVQSHLPIFYFYPRSPCGERPKIPPPDSRSPTFLSTLSLRRATGRHRFFCRALQFLSTLSLRRATCTLHNAGPWQGISIHALLAESDPRYAISCYLIR